MAFTDLGQLANGGSSGNNQSTLAVNTAANAAAGELVVVCVTVDNQASGGGDDSSTSGVTIALTGGLSPLSLTKGRQNATNLAAQAGASVSLWWGVTPIAYPSGSPITASFTTNSTSDATALTARHFSFVGLINSVAVEATNATTATTTNPGSLTATTANIACLRIRATGCEYDSTQTITTTSTWTTWTEAAAAATGTITEQVIEVEHLISTTTSAASAPTLGSACDSASVYVAFKELANPKILPVLDVPKGPRQGAVGRRTWSQSASPATLAGEIVYIPAWGEWFNPWGPKPLLRSFQQHNLLLTPPAVTDSVTIDAAALSLSASTITLLEGDIANFPAGMVGGYAPWGWSRGRQHYNQRPATLYQSVTETVTIDSGSLALSGSSIGEAETVGITSTSLSLSPSTIVANDALSVTSGALAFVGETITTLDSEVTSITSTSLSLSPQTIGVVDTETIVAGSLTLSGSEIEGEYIGFNPFGTEWFNPWGVQRGRQFWTRSSPIHHPPPTGDVTVDSASLAFVGQDIALVDAPSEVMPARVTDSINPWGRKYPTALRTWINLGLPTSNYVVRPPLIVRLRRLSRIAAITAQSGVRSALLTIPTTELISIVPSNLIPAGSTIGIIDTQAITSTSLTLSGSSVGESDSLGIGAASLTFTQSDIGVVDVTLDLTPVTAGALSLTPQSIGVVDTEVIGSQALALLGQSIGVFDSDSISIVAGILTFSPENIDTIESGIIITVNLSLSGGDVLESESTPVTSTSLAFVGSVIAVTDGVVDSVTIDAGALTLSGGSLTEIEATPFIHATLILTSQSILVTESDHTVDSTSLVLLPQDILCREVAGSHEAGPGRWYSQVGSWRPKDRAGPRYKIYPS